jgi:heptaprenyl diphosphate synthase
MASPTERPLRLAATRADHEIAHMAALAIALSLAEAALPSPLPGVKPGLANIVTLVVLLRHGWRTAAWVSLLRVLVGSMLLGSFLSPGFVLSAGGAAASLGALSLTRTLPARWFGPVTHSVCAALAHIAAQLAIVYFWLIPHAALWRLSPFFALAALLFGAVNGLAAARLLGEPQAWPAGAVTRPDDPRTMTR